jgi:hypothetical protein
MKVTSIKLLPEDEAVIQDLNARTGILNLTDLVRLCLRVASRSSEIPAPPEPLEDIRA